TMGVVVLLAVATASVAWFDYAAVGALFFPTRDPLGHTIFQVPGYANTVYPFTYAGVALSLAGVSWFVYLRERGELRRAYAGALALLVANLASVGMIDVYEQFWVALSALTPHGATARYWLGHYWGSAGDIGGTLAGMLLVLTILPWVRRSNWPSTTLAALLCALGFALWFQRGMSAPGQGDATDYAYNALTRVSAQLVLVAAVGSRDLLRGIWSALHSPHDRANPPGGPLTPPVGESAER
ncbi:MAG TPA: hypothetical protein VGU43_00160, partial [Thermoplasmata archaeon]|nr:hypothetical protein [Thermoplasmata archaeon]